MNHLGDTIVWVGAVGTALAFVIAVFRWIRRRFKSGAKDARAFKDAILGRDAVLHPDTGQELVPAVPGIGTRMSNQEQQMAVLTHAVAKMADHQGRVDALSADHLALEKRVSKLEDKDLERAMARTESIEMLRTIDTAIRSTPKEND